MIITSAQNKMIKEAAALREPKARRESGLTLVDGARENWRARQAGVQFDTIFYCTDFAPKHFNANAFKSPNTELVEVNDKVFEKLAYGQRTDGVIGVARVPTHTLKDLKLSKNPLIMIVESVEKPGNLGAILRTCDGAGVDALIIGDPKTDVFNPNAIRASIGAVFNVPVVAAANDDIAAFLKKHGIKAYGAFLDAKETYTKISYKGPTAIVVGAEDEGLSEFWKKHSASKMKIPMNGRADSLNVSVSAAIVLYEAIRQRSS